MLRALIHRDVSYSFQSIQRCTKFVQSSYHSQRCSSTVKQQHSTNQLILDYAQLLDYVRPEMAQRIQQLLDHDTYLHSLSQQIQEKKTYHETLETTQQNKEPEPHNQRLSKVVVQSLQSTKDNADNQQNTETNVPQYEPGLNLQDFSSIKSLQSTFYGPSPLSSFSEFENMDKHLIKAINDIGITIPSHIQQLAVPQIIKGNNCVIGAETGTGKTIAFVLPILHKLLCDTRVTEAQYEPVTNRERRSSDENAYEKHHPFEYDAEKKHPPFVIITPNEHLSKQTQKVIDEILGRYYDNIYYENRNNPNFYKLKTMSLHGRALLPKSNELMPDILITTPTALLTNLHKKHNENRFRSFLSKIKYVVLDEADYLTRSSSRSQIQYLFAKLSELRQQIENNPLKYKLLLPKYLREEAYGATSSSIFRELNHMAKPQIVFVGATIPTEGTKNVAETVRNWLDKAVWIRTPGLHDVGSHIAQEFRFVPRSMELDILHQVLIALAREHLYKTLWFQSDDDILSKEEEKHDPEFEKGKHKKRKRRAKKPKHNMNQEWENKQKEFHVLIFVNSKKFTRECYKYLLDNGWFNTRCIHSQLHREERKLRLHDFENSVSCSNNEMSDNVKRRNIAINEEINDKEENIEYKEVVNNVHLLVTSDFANRGVDFKNVDVVINCQFPKNAVDYLHRCGRTGRGAGHSNKNEGQVISFFNEYDLDLAWHIQMALINQYKNILSNISEQNEASETGEYTKRIGTNSVQLDDCFGIEQDKLSLILKSNRGYNRLSLPREYEKAVDLTRCDLDEMDEKVLTHIIKYAKDEKWIEKKGDDKGNKQQLQQLINERKEQKRKLKMPWPFQLELTNE